MSKASGSSEKRIQWVFPSLGLKFSQPTIEGKGIEGFHSQPAPRQTGKSPGELCSFLAGALALMVS